MGKILVVALDSEDILTIVEESYSNQVRLNHALCHFGSRIVVKAHILVNLTDDISLVQAINPWLIERIFKLVSLNDALLLFSWYI